MTDCNDNAPACSTHVESTAHSAHSPRWARRNSNNCATVRNRRAAARFSARWASTTPAINDSAAADRGGSQ